ncbi:MAG TPA: sulfite exporter TauE/SafE family protein [Thermohalobaculum sp.]|nr:sulfite exporter TauE/SafE family protein [Thermohalobaculum sp.]
MDFFASLAEIEPMMLIAASAIMLFGGFVKGAIGFALPMIGIGGIGSFMSAQETVAILVFPTVLSNLMQTMRQGIGPAVMTLRFFWKLNLLLGMTIGVAAQFVPGIPSAVMFIFLGAVICSAASLQLLGWNPRAPTAPGLRALLEATTGLLAGICGGLSGVWAPPVLFFLIALDLDKVLHIRALGLSLLVGSLILVPAHFYSGLLDRVTLPMSLAMCLPMVVGMLIGQRFQDRMDQALFRKVALAVLCVAGLNLLRRGLM